MTKNIMVICENYKKCKSPCRHGKALHLLEPDDMNHGYLCSTPASCDKGKFKCIERKEIIKL